MHARFLSRCAAPALLAALAVIAMPAGAQPTFGNPSPTAGSDTSQRANQSADQALYKPVEYVNAGKKGPALVVIPGGSWGGARAGAVGQAAVGSVQTGESSGVWIIGMRYKIINAETTEQLAQGYTEEKMEVGAKSTSVLGVSQSQQGGVSLDTMVQRLVQKSVWEIDSKYK